jgi:hypothetical protein
MCAAASVMRVPAFFAALWLVSFCGPGQPAAAAVRRADPSNYRALVRTLKPGDTLKLASGTYPRLFISGLNGTPEAWITIAGPGTGAPAVIAGAPLQNTIEIENSSYVSIEDLRIDSRGIPGVFGVSAKGGESNLTHDVRIAGNTFVGQGGGQQTVAISTKVPTWGWIIRYNQILGAGTGLYLGNSDGSEPFVAGIIEHNLVKDTIGYNMEIKHQKYIPALDGMPMQPTSTIIRNNVFIKNDQPSPDGDRPNVLLGDFPFTGAGSLNMYEVYGNFFYHNRREALFQGSGRVSVHDNLFVDGPYTYAAVVFRNHNGPLKIAYFYNNTVYTSQNGVYFGARATVDDAVVGNAIFAQNPISGPVMRQADNLVDAVHNASSHVRSPAFDLVSMNLQPVAGKCQGSPIDLSPFQTNTHYTVDFNGVSKPVSKGAVVFRGAYADDGSEAGWRPNAGIKPPYAAAPASAMTLAWISPPSGQPGTRKEVTLTGANFREGATAAVSGGGVTIGGVKVISATEMTITMIISANAASGVRDVSISTPDGGSNSLKFRVNSRGASSAHRTQP